MEAQKMLNEECQVSLGLTALLLTFAVCGGGSSMCNYRVCLHWDNLLDSVFQAFACRQQGGGE